jgi:hypothetical protein
MFEIRPTYSCFTEKKSLVKLKLPRHFVSLIMLS